MSSPRLTGDLTLWEFPATSSFVRIGEHFTKQRVPRRFACLVFGGDAAGETGRSDRQFPRLQAVP